MTMKPPTYGAYPTNGGPLDVARPKLGRWIPEPKFNGWAAIAHVPSGALFNAHTLAPSTIAHEFKPALEALAELDHQICRLEWVHVEALERRHGIGKGCLIVLDLIDEATKPYEARRELMLDLLPELNLTPPADFPLLSIPPAICPTLDVWRDLQAINKRLGCEFYEGMVMKRTDSLYPIQLRSPKEPTRQWVKHRWQW